MRVTVKVSDKDRGWAKMVRAAEALAGGSYAKVGILGEESTGGLPGADLTMVELGTIHEFGTADGRIPARSFVRSTFDIERERLAQMARRLVWEVLSGDQTVDRALNVLGAYLAAAIKRRVTDGPGIPPPNAPATVRAKEAHGRWNRRGKAAAAGVRTLIDTGRMIGAVTWAVVSGGERGGSAR